jgi:hypothetical protein
LGNVVLDLALDVDDLIGFCLCQLKNLASLPGKQFNSVFLLLEEFLRGMVQDEACALLVRLKSEFLGDEPYLDIGFISVGLSA